MVRVGLVGLGFMGMIHYLAHRKGSATKVVALCAPEEHRLAGDWTDIKGNFGPPGTKMDLSEHAKYREIDELLERRLLVGGQNGPVLGTNGPQLEDDAVTATPSSRHFRVQLGRPQAFSRDVGDTQRDLVGTFRRCRRRWR